MLSSAGTFSSPGVELPSSGGVLRVDDVDGDGPSEVIRRAQIFWGSVSGLSATPISIATGAGLGFVGLDGDRLKECVGSGGGIILWQVAPRLFLAVPNGLGLAADSLLDVGHHDGKLDAVGSRFVHFGDS